MPRHTLRKLLMRGLVAAVGGVGIASGMYPVAPHVGLAVMRRVRGRRQPASVGRVLAAEWALSAALQALRPLGLLAAPLLMPQARGPRPVLLVHGYAQGSANFVVLAHRLRALGLGPLLGFEYWTFGRVEAAARRLGAFIQRVRDRTGAAQIDLVGHSMGGVVARAYVSALGGAPSVANLITIGSPHGGSAASRFGLGWPSVELRRGSSFLGALTALPAPAGVRVTCIWSRADGLVGTRAEASISGAEEIVLDDLGHMGLLASRRVARAVFARLRLP